jgi:hypothetical protein
MIRVVLVTNANEVRFIGFEVQVHGTMMAHSYGNSYPALAQSLAIDYRSMIRRI